MSVRVSKSLSESGSVRFVKAKRKRKPRKKSCRETGALTSLARAKRKPKPGKHCPQDYKQKRPETGPLLSVTVRGGQSHNSWSFVGWTNTPGGLIAFVIIIAMIVLALLIAYAGWPW